MIKGAEQKFVTLRKQLDQLGYRHAFGIDSMPLVNQLFSDLLHTTESLKKVKAHLYKAVAPAANPNIDDILEPYGKDNARLVQENNNLHLQCVRLKEEAETAKKELKARILKLELEHEKADLRFLNNQFVHKIGVLESETSSKTDTIQKLQEKNLQAVIQTPGGQKRNIPFRRQHMQIESPVPPSLLASYISSQPNDPYVADLLKVADNKIEQLAVEVKILSEANFVCESKIETLREQVETRDREIERLERSLEGGRPHDILSREAKNSANERLISRLNLQVDYLQQTNEELVTKMKEHETRGEELLRSEKRYEEEVERLKLEIREIDHLAQQMEKEKKTVVSTADLEIQKAQEELRLSQRQENNLERQLQAAKESRENLVLENEDLQLKMQAQEQETVGLNELLDKLKDDKDLLNKKVKNLLNREKELILELEEHQLFGIGMHKKGKCSSKLDGFIHAVEQERDYYINKCDLLNSMLRKRDRQEDTQKNLRSASQIPRHKMADKSATEQLKEYEKVVKERDELQAMLDKFEKHVSEIQINVKILTQERDKTNLLYEQAHEELQRSRREAVRSPKSAKASLTTQAIENERDDAIADLRRMTTERDCLRECIELHKNQSSANLSEMDQKLLDLADRVNALKRERHELQLRLQAAKELNIAKDDDLKNFRAKFQEVESEKQDAQHRYEEVQAIRLQFENSLKTSKHRISEDIEELDAARERIKVLEETLTKQSDDVTGLRATVTVLDREKDGLQVILDDETEEIAILEEKLEKRESRIKEQKVTMENVEKQLGRVTEKVTGTNREIQSLGRQLDMTQSELTEALRASDVAARENGRLQEDLAILTRENQDLNIELDNVLRERKEGRGKLKEYIAKVADSEGSVASKEREMNDLLEQYGKVSVERDTTESKYRLLVDEAQALKLELVAAENKNASLEDKAHSVEQEILEHLRSQQIYENSIEELTANVRRLESEIQHAIEERTSIAVDLASATDINGKLDIGKEQIMRQLASKNVEYEQLKVKYDEQSREIEILQDQLDRDVMEKNNLEALIATSREKGYQAQMSMQEVTESYENIKDQLSLAERKLAHQGREVTMLRAKVSQLDADLEITKRQLTNQRYERERALQELRKHNLPSPSTSRLTLSDHPSPSQRPRSVSPARASFPDPKYVTQ